MFQTKNVLSFLIKKSQSLNRRLVVLRPRILVAAWRFRLFNLNVRSDLGLCGLKRRLAFALFTHLDCRLGFPKPFIRFAL